ncbi:hypothetical protein OIU85_015426 [Salix viminalis]|uniref:Uncharacterized protein n=1 Tax=Salix viminalis TaxID=40686 RepID=A0A9Q0NKV3_SALVM|nr:hypothetical protein OIU85_015426 [Salix viminalis]
MTTQGLLLRSPSSNRRMQPLLTETTGPKTVPTGEGREKSLVRTKKQSFGEVAGGTAAVCCCCPCTVINLLFLTVYKVPACLLKKAKIRRRLRKKKKKERSLLSPPGGGSRDEELQSEKKAAEAAEKGKCCDHHDHNHDEETEAADLETQMWDQFHSTGFWRSPSQRDVGFFELDSDRLDLYLERKGTNANWFLLWSNVSS